MLVFIHPTSKLSIFTWPGLKDSEFSSRSGLCLPLVGENAYLTSSSIQQPLPLKWILPMKAVGAA